MSQCAEDLGDIDKARKTLRLLIRRWPSSALVPDASRRLNELTMRIWKKAAERSAK
jgi:outer membrane protein assembly factor BamD (BamD/ComL family)